MKRFRFLSYGSRAIARRGRNAFVALLMGALASTYGTAQAQTDHVVNPGDTPASITLLDGDTLENSGAIGTNTAASAVTVVDDARNIGIGNFAVIDQNNADGIGISLGAGSSSAIYNFSRGVISGATAINAIEVESLYINNHSGAAISSDGNTTAIFAFDSNYVSIDNYGTITGDAHGVVLLNSDHGSVNNTGSINTNFLGAIICDRGDGLLLQNAGGTTDPNSIFVINGFAQTGGHLDDNNIRGLLFETDGELFIHNPLNVTEDIIIVREGTGVISGDTITGSNRVKFGSGELVLDAAVTDAGNFFANFDGRTVLNGIIYTDYVYNAPNAFLGGSGVFDGDLYNDGFLNPGNSPGMMTVTGDFHHSAPGVLMVEVESSSNHDRLVVGGTALLGRCSRLGDSAHIHSLRSNLGARVAYRYEINEHAVVVPELRASREYELLNDARNIDGQLSGKSITYRTQAGERASFGVQW